jgi:hypothetical protein
MGRSIDQVGVHVQQKFFISFLVRFLMNSNDEKDGDSGSTAKTKFKYILERICGQT